MNRSPCQDCGRMVNLWEKSINRWHGRVSGRVRLAVSSDHKPSRISSQLPDCLVVKTVDCNLLGPALFSRLEVYEASGNLVSVRV